MFTRLELYIKAVDAFNESVATPIVPEQNALHKSSIIREQLASSLEQNRAVNYWDWHYNELVTRAPSAQKFVKQVRNN